jgi:DNA-binding MarR family transcriptional regulator
MKTDLTRAELRTWVTLTHGMRSLLIALDRQLRADHGISHDDYQILAHLARSPDGLRRMGDLAKDVGQSPSHISHAVARLEREGWVERVPGSGDRRVVEARLTDRGARWVEEVSVGHLALVRTLLFDTLGPQRARELAELMREVGDAARRG